MLDLFLLRLSDTILLRDNICKKYSDRIVPLGMMISTMLFVGIFMITGTTAVLVAIPVLILYSYVYAAFLHFAVKDANKSRGSYMQSVDNVMAAFVYSALLASFASPALISAVYLTGLIVHVPNIVEMFMGLAFFFCYMKLSLFSYEDIDLDHLFGASFIPFILLCAALYFM